MSRYAPAAVIRIASCITTVLMSALVSPAPVLAGAEPQVLVTGTELRLVDADGTVRAGDDLVGGELTLRDGYGEHRLRIEAAWGPGGASCVAYVRVPENGSLDDIVRSCPRLAGKVGPAACPPRLPAAGDGVLIVNKS